MFKFLKVTILSLMVVCTFSACGKSDTASASADVNSNANSVEAESVESVNKKESKKVVKVIDVDLTKLSSTMVYSEVQQMVWHPEKYVGKVVKMNGAVSIFESPEMNRTYYTCIVADATACCQQGIEFRLIGNKPLPSSYQEGSDITVVGEFSTYKEGEKTYYELINAKLL